MKKIRISFCILLLSLMVAGLAGCSNRDNANQGTTGGRTTQAETSAGQTGSGAAGQSGGSGMENGSGSSGNGGNSSGSGQDESSTGVIDGLMDDVENGVNDLTGETSSAAADESR